MTRAMVSACHSAWNWDQHWSEPRVDRMINLKPHLQQQQQQQQYTEAGGINKQTRTRCNIAQWWTLYVVHAVTFGTAAKARSFRLRATGLAVIAGVLFIQCQTDSTTHLVFWCQSSSFSVFLQSIRLDVYGSETGRSKAVRADSPLNSPHVHVTIAARGAWKRDTWSQRHRLSFQSLRKHGPNEWLGLPSFHWRSWPQN